MVPEYVATTDGIGGELAQRTDLAGTHRAQAGEHRTDEVGAHARLEANSVRGVENVVHLPDRHTGLELS